LSNDILGHRGRIEGNDFKVLCLGLEELFVLPFAIIMVLQTRNMLRVGRNEPHKTLATIPRLVAHGIEERGERVILHLFGGREPFDETPVLITLLKFRPNRTTERSDSVNDNHTPIITHIRILSNGNINIRQLFYTVFLGFRENIYEGRRMNYVPSFA